MKRRSQPSTTRSRWTSALVIVLLAFSSGCAGAPPEVPAPDKEAAVESPREAPTFGGPLFDDVAANANLFAADTRIVVVVRADNAIAPTWIDALLGVVPTAKLQDAPAFLSEAPLAEARSDISTLFSERLGFVPASDADRLVLAAGPNSGTVVVSGAVNYKTPPKEVSAQGHDLLQVDLPDVSYGPLFAIELDDGKRTAVYLSKDQAVAAAAASDGRSETGLVGERLEHFRNCLGGRDGYLGIAAKSDSAGFEDLLEAVFFDPLNLYAKTPRAFAVVAGSALEISFFDTRAKLGAIEQDTRERLVKIQQKAARLRDRRLDSVPLAAAPLIMSQAAVIETMAREVETVLTTESLTYRVPLEPIESRRAMLGLAALHMPVLAMLDQPEGAENSPNDSGTEQ